ncbi:cation efflux protein [Coniophora puteana RWD-64-598 SS2]|uniref:Cation efflux protein n=1 Tax=Coniophora puteana (strain RWD-64-598) TaxID=741705 RepID=A0A5M3N723_CONPW|nr:cation efflux protein [Coniophora puteana RWD-64-598 SS2]EIW86645.1 cation efflux protein [Coniophora puteana RWD-64-598 SS2]
MAFSRSARITLLLVIDVFFFFVELIVGYAVGSLALVADSFHMLNDVMSLIVALYAIKLTSGPSEKKDLSYGWQRAEILAALVNGVFLLALCFSITMEAIGRFFSTPEISNPKLVIAVGSLGLVSNIVGLFLFHEHGHSHEHNATSRPPSPSADTMVASPESELPDLSTPAQRIPVRSPGRTSDNSYGEMYGHPAATRASLMQAAQDMASSVGAPGTSPSRTRRQHSRPSVHLAHPSGDQVPTPYLDDNTEQTPLLGGASSRSHDHPVSSTPSTVSNAKSVSPSPSSHSHGHGHGHGHNHSGSMNMRALVLHVLGDALGNVGVIATGLIIWLTSWSFKYYFDPIISLVITVIIFSSALPLVRSASFILLQGVPPNISIEDVRESIWAVEGVLSVHELHIWQLSESKVIASVHVLASRELDFMPVAVEIRRVLHLRGIHSSTIQPEYHPSSTTDAIPEEHLKGETSCLILCPADENCDPLENACCPPLAPSHSDA